MKYFEDYEFTMGDKFVFDYMSKSFLNKLDALRDELGFYIKLNSSYRSVDYNSKIGGAKSSYHLKGRAVDVDITRYTADQRIKLVSLAINNGFTVGFSKTFIHLDDRETQTIFGYS